MFIKSKFYKNSLKKGILYAVLYNQLIDKYGENKEFPLKEFYCKLGRDSKIPKQLRCFVLEEMEDKDFIKKISRDKILLLSQDKIIKEIFFTTT